MQNLFVNDDAIVMAFAHAPMNSRPGFSSVLTLFDGTFLRFMCVCVAVKAKKTYHLLMDKRDKGKWHRSLDLIRLLKMRQ